MVIDRQPKISVENVAQLCVEYWKLAEAIEKALGGFPPKDGKRLEAQLKFSKRQLNLLLKELGLHFVDLAGEQFRPGLAVSIANAADYDDEEALIISKTLEPTVMFDMTVVRLGRAVVEPIEQKEG